MPEPTGTNSKTRTKRTKQAERAEAWAKKWRCPAARAQAAVPPRPDQLYRGAMEPITSPGLKVRRWKPGLSSTESGARRNYSHSLGQSSAHAGSEPRGMLSTDSISGLEPTESLLTQFVLLISACTWSRSQKQFRRKSLRWFRLLPGIRSFDGFKEGLNRGA